MVESSSDIDDVADLVTDPTKVFVPNTTCATCHRMNGLRFDFHSLSHLEDRDHTVSPRVEADVAHELDWVARWTLNGAPATVETSSSSASSDTSSDTRTDDPGTTEDTASPARAWEPNESVTTAPARDAAATRAEAAPSSDVEHRIPLARGLALFALILVALEGMLRLVGLVRRG